MDETPPPFKEEEGGRGFLPGAGFPKSKTIATLTIYIYITKITSPYMVQLDVMSKKIGNEFGSRFGRETRRGNMFGSVFLGGPFFWWQAWYFGDMMIICAGWRRIL